VEQAKCDYNRNCHNCEHGAQRSESTINYRTRLWFHEIMLYDE
jgi:hypothetical protein